MRKHIIVFFAFLISMFSAEAQLTVNFSDAQVDQNGSATVDVTVQNFTDIIAFQFSVNWDSLVLDYTSVNNFTTLLPSFDASAFGEPGSGPGVQNGQLIVQWFNPSGQANTLPNNTRLFSIHFTAIGGECDSSLVSMTNTPNTIEFINSNVETVATATNPGTVLINGVDCSDPPPPPPPTGLKFYAPTITALAGSTICIPIKADSFVNLAAGQGVFKWDPAVLQFKEFRRTLLPATVPNETQVANGKIGFVWFDDAKTFPDGTTIYELCFDVIGANGTMSPIDIVDYDAGFDLEWLWVNDDGDEVPFTLVDGKVTVGDPPPPIPVKFILSNVTVDQDSNICVEVSVEDFTDIISIQGTFTWDNLVVQYTNPGGINLAGLVAANFNQVDANHVRFNWTSPMTNPISLPDGTVIFTLCFKGLTCTVPPSPSTVDFITLPTFALEVINNDTEEVPYEVDAGSITVINCDGDPLPPECKIISFQNVSCKGGSDGSIITEIKNVDPSCNCVWKKNGIVIATNTVANCNLTNIPAGDYLLEVTCNGNIVCSLNVPTITEPSAITINSDPVKHVLCGQLGEINISATGGTPPYTYAWSAGVPANTTTNAVGLAANSYTVTVTDSKACTSTKSFVVNDNNTDMTVTSNVTNVLCNGQNTGAISLIVSGGCVPYQFAWNPSTVTGSNPTGLAANTYSVTISDSSNPAKTLVRSYTISQPSNPLSIVGTTTDSHGSDGTINVVVTGGTLPYTSLWTNGIPPNTFNATGLAPNTYIITVTDANGCTGSGTFVVGVITDPGSDPKFGTLEVISKANFNGFGVGCNGDCTGQITGSVIDGAGPYTITVTPNSGSQTLTAPGNFSVNNLCPNTYTLTVTDAMARSSSRTIVVDQPPLLTASFSAGCTDGGEENGSINVTVTGGVPGYLYNWTTGEETQDLNSLNVGTYGLTITDKNGCETLVNNVNIENCDEKCFRAISVITPNGDGINDQFKIECVQNYNSELTLFDRWGRLVYNQDDYDESWEGVGLNGEDLPEGGYMWVLIVGNGLGTQQIFKGTLTILREE